MKGADLEENGNEYANANADATVNANDLKAHHHTERLSYTVDTELSSILVRLVQLLVVGVGVGVWVWLD